MPQPQPALMVYIIDANGRAKAKATEVRMYDQSATDPAPLVGPDSGDLYFNTVLKMWMAFDAVRLKWLSIETGEIAFARNGNTGAGAYYRGVDRKSYSSTSGRNAEYNGTVVSMTYVRTDTDAAVFQATADGSSIAILASSTTSGADTTLNGDFLSGQVLGARNMTGGNRTSNVAGFIRIKWRA